jgi:hypothetical protein
VLLALGSAGFYRISADERRRGAASSSAAGPIGGEMAYVLLRLARRLRLPSLVECHSRFGILACSRSSTA